MSHSMRVAKKLPLSWPNWRRVNSRRLSALARIKQGIYGVCEHCQGKIPVARLNALPYSTTCIECQREMETYPGGGGRRGGDWEKVYDAGTSLEEEREINLSDIEMDLSSH